MRIRRFGILLILMFTWCANVTIIAQESKWKGKMCFDHLDLGLSLGTTGLSLDLGTPVTSWCRARIGFDYMPHFMIPMTFDLQSITEDGQIGGDFASMQSIMEQFTGFTIDQSVKMEGHGRFADFTFMLDFYPLPNNKHWTATAGFYWGTSKIGHAQNTIKEAPTLVGVIIYNNMYDFFIQERYLYDPIYKDVYLDPDMGDVLRDKFRRYGRIGVNLGNFKDSGKPFILEPDKDGMVTADMYVNSFKPYLGLGYETWLGKEQKWNFGVNLGCLFWGGTPRIYTLDTNNRTRVDMSNELEGIPGKVGDYVNIATHFKVYPLLGVRLSYRLL